MFKKIIKLNNKLFLVETKISIKKLKRYYIKMKKFNYLQIVVNKINLNKVEKIIKTHEKWIIKNREALFKKYIEKKYLKSLVKTNKIYYLDKEYDYLIFTKSKFEKLILKNNKFIFYTKSSKFTEKKFKQMVEEFSAMILLKVYKVVYKRVSNFYKINFLDLKIKTLKSKWGSFHLRPEKFITLNSKLIFCSYEFIYYVILHECLHEIFFHHKKSFYDAIDFFFQKDYKKMQRYFESKYL